jgi:hypothetical protein
MLHSAITDFFEPGNLDKLCFPWNQLDMCRSIPGASTKTFLVIKIPGAYQQSTNQTVRVEFLWSWAEAHEKDSHAF